MSHIGDPNFLQNLDLSGFQEIARGLNATFRKVPEVGGLPDNLEGLSPEVLSFLQSQVAEQPSKRQEIFSGGRASQKAIAKNEQLQGLVLQALMANSSQQRGFDQANQLQESRFNQADQIQQRGFDQAENVATTLFDRGQRVASSNRLQSKISDILKASRDRAQKIQDQKQALQDKIQLKVVDAAIEKLKRRETLTLDEKNAVKESTAKLLGIPVGAVTDQLMEDSKDVLKQAVSLRVNNTLEDLKSRPELDKQVGASGGQIINRGMTTKIPALEQVGGPNSALQSILNGGGLDGLSSPGQGTGVGAGPGPITEIPGVRPMVINPLQQVPAPIPVQAPTQAPFNPKEFMQNNLSPSTIKIGRDLLQGPIDSSAILNLLKSAGSSFNKLENFMDRRYTGRENF